MSRYIKWFIRLIVGSILYIGLLPILALLYWIENDKTTIKSAIKQAYSGVESNWWALNINE